MEERPSTKIELSAERLAKLDLLIARKEGAEFGKVGAEYGDFGDDVAEVSAEIAAASVDAVVGNAEIGNIEGAGVAAAVAGAAVVVAWVAATWGDDKFLSIPEGVRVQLNQIARGMSLDTLIQVRQAAMTDGGKKAE